MNYATIDDQNSKNYEVIKEQDITVLLDKKAVFFVVGTVMDYEVKILVFYYCIIIITTSYIYSPFTVLVYLLYYTYMLYSYLYIGDGFIGRVHIQ